MTLKIGSTLPLVGSGCGAVFRACLPPAAIADLIARREDAVRPGHAATPGSLARIQAELRETGAVWTEEAVLPGAVCAVPIFDKPGELYCVIGCSVARQAGSVVDRTAIVATMAAAGRRLSQALGLPGAASPAAAS